MISLTAEYALRAIVLMASRPATAVGTRGIADATQVPVGYLSKVLQALARVGLVRSRPGRSGGFVLGREPKAISVLDIVQAVDPIQRVRRCPLGRREHSGKLCPLHRRLDHAVALVERAFRESTIAELVAEATDQRALCAANARPGTTIVQTAHQRPRRGRRSEVQRRAGSTTRRPVRPKAGR